MEARKTITISFAAWQALKRRTIERGVSLQAVVDELLGLAPGLESPGAVGNTGTESGAPSLPPPSAPRGGGPAGDVTRGAPPVAAGSPPRAADTTRHAVSNYQILEVRHVR